MENNKKISKSGGITLPSSIRRAYGLNPGESLAVSIDEKGGNIILHRNNGLCIFCGADHPVILYKGRYICKDCAQKIEEAFAHDN